MTRGTVMVMKSFDYIKVYLLTFGVFLGIDFIWLSFVAQSFYQEQIGFLLMKQPNVFAAFLFYAIYVVGILYFVLLPALKSKKISAAHVALAGGFYGFVAYATYDLTNYATIEGWPLTLVVVDMIWGFVLTGAVSGLSFILARKFIK